MKVVGLDLSLTCTGVAVATQDGAITDRITSSPARTEGRPATHTPGTRRPPAA
jgi:hypothetical protein